MNMISLILIMDGFSDKDALTIIAGLKYSRKHAGQIYFVTVLRKVF